MRLRFLTANGRFSLVVGTIAAAALITLAAGCGGGGSGSSQTGMVTTQISDPAPCTDQYSHVWVTVSDVEAHTSPDADSGFTDLTPKLSANPVQIDLMAPATTECTLATLGAPTGIPAGKYQQIRLELLPNSAPADGVTPPSANECSGAGSNVFNCVVLAGSTTPIPLTTPSGSIKIPPGQLAQGGLTVPAGEAVDLDIDFNACMSVVQSGNSGKYKIKPTLRAGELGTNPLISGTVVQASVSDGTVTPGTTLVPDAHVWLEEQSTDYTVGDPAAGTGTVPVENLIQQVSSSSDGSFEFCPVMAGNYEIVADAESLPTGSAPSAATIATGVQVSSSGGPNDLVVPLVPQSAATPTIATVAAVFSTKNNTASGDDIAAFAAQPFTPAGSSTPVYALVPFLKSATAGMGTSPVPPNVTTSSAPTNTDCSSIASLSCPTGTNCACLDLGEPASNPIVGAANTTGDGYTVPASAPFEYSIGATATAIGGESTAFVCTDAQMITALFGVPAGVSQAANPTLSFAGCD